MSCGTPSAEWVGRQLDEIEGLWDELRIIKNEIGDPACLRHAAHLMRMPPTVEIALRNLEVIKRTIATPINWTHLEEWIESAQEEFRNGAEGLYNTMTTLGIDPTGLSIADAREKLQTAPVLRRSLGFNYFELMDVPSAPSSATTIPADIFWTSVLRVIRKIEEGWKALQRKNGSLAEFRRKWAQLPPQAKRAWLKQCYPELPSSSYPDLYACVNESGVGTRGSTFLKALINIGDLSEADNLPSLLEMRARFHPKLFQAVEGRAVRLGLWSKRIKEIRAPGRLFFGSADHAEGASICIRNSAASQSRQCYTDSDFGISFEPHYNRYDIRLDSDTACCGFYKLQALKGTYEMLSSCVPKFLSDSKTNSGILSAYALDKRSEAPSNENVSLLIRSSRLDYNGHPTIIDLEYLVGLVKDSLDEMQHDLWQLRQDAELWQNRLAETSAKTPGLVSNLLLALFSRIDTFDALSQHLQDMLERRDRLMAQDAPPSTLLEDRDALLLVASLHDELQAGFGEGLNRLRNTVWSPSEQFSVTFTRLFDMIIKDDPILRVMGLPAVMKTLDTELGKTPEPIPLAVSRALNDLSILAVCLRETDKHYSFLSYGQVIDLANTIEERKNQGRPWLSVARRVLDGLGEDRCRKLQDGIRGKSVDHRTFWNAIDHRMTKLHEMELKAVVDEIQRTAPVDAKQAQSPPVAPFASLGDARGPTQTQVKQSKPKQPRQALTSPTAPLLPESVSARTLPEIIPKRHVEFWAALQTQGSERSFHWKEFCQAMEGIGCTITTTIGSCRRFKWEDANGESSFTIIFHEPRPNKLTHSQAQGWWLRRLQDRFTLVVEQ